MYKLGSAMRENGPILDLMGPWYHDTFWPMVWGDFNVQLIYWTHLTANRMSVGESLGNNIDKYAGNLANNGPAHWKDSANVATLFPQNMDARIGAVVPDMLAWILHNYWLHCEYAGDRERLRDGVFPVLRQTMNSYLNYLQENPVVSDDGTIHIKHSWSPEYPAGRGQDINFTIALIQWTCQTLLAINDEFDLNDPLAPEWQRVSDHLVDYQIDENGLRIGKDIAFDKPHRHYSHLLAFYPLALITPETEANAKMLRTTLDHWLDVSFNTKNEATAMAVTGYTATGASSMYAWLGDNEQAYHYLNYLIQHNRVSPTTMYAEGNPVIESPLSFATSVHDMLLQSWGGQIRVFPATPEHWGDVVLSADVTNFRDEVGPTLVLSRIHWVFSFYSETDPSDTSKLIPFINVSPVLTIWNPYNVALQLESNELISSRFPQLLPFKFKFSVGGNELGGFETITQIVRKYTVRNLNIVFSVRDSNWVWKPGESRIYSIRAGNVDVNRPDATFEPGYRSDTGYRWQLADSSDLGADFEVELEKYSETAFKLPLKKKHLRVIHSTSIDPSVLDAYWPDEDLTVTNTEQTLESVQDSPEPFLVAVTQLRNVLERSTDSLGYAQSKPIIGFASNTTSEGAALTNPEAYPLDWRFFTPSNLFDTDSLPQDGPANSSYIGTSFRAAEGLSGLVVAELPTRPLRSMGELQHFDINYNNPRPPYSANPIGNSLASHLILPDTVSVDESVAVSARVSLDHSYISNHLLYDDWFVSSIAPETAPFSSAEQRSVEKTYEEFVSGVEPLPNSAYVAAEPLSAAEASTAASDLIDDSKSWHSVASKLEVDGMFNINSTSVAAWTALLKHADGDDVPYTSVDLAADSWSVDLDSASGSPVSRTSIAGDPQANFAPNIQQIGMHQRLSDAQVRALATEIVEQIKARGPFLSLSEFMNRRLSSDRSLARSGAVEAALNELATLGASENPFSDIQSYFTETVTVPSGVTYPFQEAAEGNLAYGFPGWMRQADVLRPIAPILSARDDTFVIRAYGESKDPMTGKAKAGAWCEAVLQRRADYVDSINDDAITLPSESTLTSEINKRFGRRFVIVSFRWLAADEV